tara:strand:- start:764 stop:3475 length:2712 start_codon:yes stop_codon:yes gene_type:complete
MVVATTIGVLAAGGVGVFTFGAAAAGWASVGWSIVANVAMGAALQALAPKPTVSGANRGYDTNSIGPAQDHQVIYGKMKVGGAIVFDEATGNNNKFLHRVIAVAGHEVESFESFYLNDDLISATVGGYLVSENYSKEARNFPETTFQSGRYYSNLPEGVGTEFSTYEELQVFLTGGGIYPTIAAFASMRERLVRINTHNGSPDQDADTDLVTESSKWGNDHKLSGIAYMYVRLKFNADAFPNGIPVITAIVKGKKLYDPRTSTTSWSDNPALCLRDYLTSKYGLEENTVNIDDTLVTSSANICDQTNTIAGTTRYTCNGAFTTASTPYDMISELLKSMGGSLWYAQGKWRMKPAYWTDTVMDLDEGDLRSGISVSTRHSRRDNFNVIKGTFRGEESNWQVTDYPQVTSTAYKVADGGQESVADVDLSFTDNFVEARRLGLISLERNRQQITVNASFGLRTLGLQVGDNVRISNERFGWVLTEEGDTRKEFEVVSWSFGLTDGLDLQTQMTLRETAESVFDEVDDGVKYEIDNTSLLSPFLVPSVGLTVVARTQVIREKLTNIITLTVTSLASERIDYVECEFKLSSADTDSWITLGTGQIGAFEAIDLEDGSYDFRARAINTFGVRAEWSYFNNVAASAGLAPPSDVTGFVAEVNGSVITLDWEAITDLDLSYYRIRYSTEFVGATWANSLTYVDKVPRPASSVSVPARAGTYLVRAYDKSGQASVNYTSVIVPLANIAPLSQSTTLTDSPSFTGSKTNTEVVSNSLRLDDYVTSPSEGEYLFSNHIETSGSSVTRCRVYVSATTVRHDNTAGLFDDQPNLFEDAVGLFDDLGGNSQFADTNIITLVSTTQDDPDGTPTWSSYTTIKIADLSARAFRFKVKLTSSSNNITPSVTSLTAYVEEY